MSEPETPWAEYVQRLRRELDMSQTEFAEAALGSTNQQGKVSRWEAGKQPPDKAADVAAFARALGRNPLEAFVAAGMLDIDEAGRGLGMMERLMLRAVGVGSKASDQLVEEWEAALHAEREDLASDLRDVVGYLSEPFGRTESSVPLAADEDLTQPIERGQGHDINP